MLPKKNYIIVGLTTFDTEFMRISVPAIAKLKQKIYLIVHNDNPDTKVTAYQIRRLGYRGPLHIINASKNFGSLESRLNILFAIKDLQINSDWMVFVDDDDIITNVDIPVVQPNNFAVMQNMAIIKRRLLDLLKIMDNYKNCVIDEDNIVIERPHIGIAGTLVRTKIMINLAELIDKIIDKVHEIDDSLGYRPPDDSMMWAYLNIYTKHLSILSAPIYMDRVNYIATGLDSVVHKYGKRLLPPNNQQQYFEGAMRRYCKLFEELLKEKGN
ncbi:MAG: hypothetical protein JW974_00965 [Alphaproteobacteria bacterium]|nr:hypothetical protein [Alphaproteobacteria bacterium]MBN2674867.1 hypothetical protein [Alphaproteobacteria bacterium]